MKEEEKKPRETLKLCGGMKAFTMESKGKLEQKKDKTQN